MASFRTTRRFWLVFAICLLLTLSLPMVRGLFVKTILFFGRPFIVIEQNISDRLRLNPNSRQLTAERERLQKQVNDLTVQLFEANQQLETVQAITALDRFQVAAKRRLVQANVIAASPDPGIQSIVIDRGSNDGLRVGQLVVADNGYAVGKIINLHQVTSTVLLLTDRQAKLLARVQNKTQSAGIVRGERGLTLLMDFIPKNDPVANAQTIVTSGSESEIPPDILIGTILSVSAKASELFQQAIIVPTASLQRLRVVAAVIS